MNSDAAPHKRKLGQTELEVPDSEDEEDYGWDEGDDATLPPPPPQWQGSEDIILGQDVGHSDDLEPDDDGNRYLDGELEESDEEGAD